jgi:type VI protein secretion system component VasK
MLKIKALPLPQKKAKDENSGNLKNQQIKQEFLSAIKRFEKANGSDWLRRKQLIYSRPWFLVCGPTGSGKSTLLDKTGLNWVAAYPDEPEEQFQWRFANEAVWIDIPGSLLDDSASAEFQSLLRTLAWIRGRRPLDGILFVTDCELMLNAQMLSIKSLGESLRRRIDQIIKLWGIELPIYHIFTKADKITGFNTIFSDPMGKWNERVLGATLNVSIIEQKPKELFLDELSLNLDWIKEIQVKMLARDKDQANRRLICEFPIMFESLREKISSLFTTIFKNNELTGKPLFGGFFFTSCQTGDVNLQDGDTRIFDVSKTIISHPLNPNKKRASISHDTPLGATSTITSFFATPLFTSVIPKHAAPISTTEQKFRQNAISLFWKSATAIFLIILFSFFEWGASNRVRAIDKKVRADFSVPISHSTEGIKQLGGLLQHYIDFQHYEKRKTFSMFFTRYNAKGMCSEIKDAFFSSVFQTIVIPCSDELNVVQNRMVNLTESSPENDFMKLKHLLQTYLAISDSNQSHSGVIDKTIVVPILHNMALTSIFGYSNVKSDLDTILNEVISAYVDELKNSKDSKYKIKADERLVASVQEKLVGMFDVNAVYAMALNDLLVSSKNLELVDIIGNDIPLNLHSQMALNEVYTPAGWNGYARKKFHEASNIRKNIEDWAIGNNKGAYTEIFNAPQQLYSGLVKRYSEDVKTQWRNYLNSISMDRFGSFQTAQERLLQVSGSQSDIAKLIGKFADWSGGFIKSDSGIINEPAFLEFTDEMAFLRPFVVTNLPQYQKQFEEVAKGLAKSSEENSILGVFTGREGDPLLGAYQYISASVLLPLSKDQKGFLEHLLMEPYNRTTELLKPELAKNLAAKWLEVYEWYDGSLNRMYPFVDNDKEASFDAAIDFFNPVSGMFWKTVNDYFSPYVTNKRNSNFELRNSAALIPIKFSSSFLKCLDKADTISHIFFKDGKRKIWKVTIQPQMQQLGNAKSLKKAEIAMGNESVAMLTELGKSLRWPVEGDIQNVQLEFTDNLDRSGKKLMPGQWGFMRLMNSSCSQYGNNFQSSFAVELKTQHNSIIQITLPARVTVSSAEPGHPFCFNVLKGFSVPGNVLLSGGSM